MIPQLEPSNLIGRRPQSRAWQPRPRHQPGTMDESPVASCEAGSQEGRNGCLVVAIGINICINND